MLHNVWHLGGPWPPWPLNPSLIPTFLQAQCPSCHPTNTVKALKGKSTSTPLQKNARNSDKPRCFAFLVLVARGGASVSAVGVRAAVSATTTFSLVARLTLTLTQNLTVVGLPRPLSQQTHPPLLTYLLTYYQPGASIPPNTLEQGPPSPLPSPSPPFPSPPFPFP